jgi:hypothetical protein
MNRPSVVSVVIGAVGLLAAAVMGVILVNDDEAGFGATEEGFVIEPASSVGPDAFTPSVEVDGEEACDTEKFLEELTSRPDAVREWARVLGLPESEVPGYVATLTPTVLTEDTPVTNHGLRDGSAYARPSLLEAGTAVLMGSLPSSGVPTIGPPIQTPPPDTEPPETVPTTALTVPPTTAPGEEIPITRCRCGNPLLPPYAPTGDEPATTTTTSTTTTTVLDTPTDDVPVAPPPDDVPPDDDVPPEDQPPEDQPPEDQPPEDQPPEDQPADVPPGPA